MAARHRWVLGILFLLVPMACGPMTTPTTTTAPASTTTTGPTTTVVTTSGSTDRITVTFTPTEPSDTCYPTAFGLRQTTAVTATTFTLRITALGPPCEPITPVAAIYLLPPGGGQWPQTLSERLPFSIPQAGVIEVVFRRACIPSQFDVINGATPPVISPSGPFHGPLLFPLDLSTSFQDPGTPPCPSTTTTTSTTSTTTTSSTTTSTTTTSIPGCDPYTPLTVTAQPTEVDPGGTLNVSGQGTPGQTMKITFRRDGDVVDPGVQLPVGPDGTYGGSVRVPLNLRPGPWTVRADVVGCERFATTLITVRAA